MARTLSPFALIIAMGFACHGLILLTDYVIWDGWWYSHFIRNREETRYLTRILREIGRPQDMLFFLPFFLTDNIAALSKVLGVVSWVGASLCVYGFLRTALLLNKATATTIAMCNVACPFFPFCGELTYNMYLQAVLLFWLGWYLTGLRMCDRIKGAIPRVMIVAIFAASFELNSHIAHLYAVGLFVILVRCGLPTATPWQAQWRTCAAQYWELALLPVMYWIWKNTCTPTSGYYESYNSLRLSPSMIAGHYGAFLSHFPGHLARLLRDAGGIAAAAIAMLFAFSALRRPAVDGLGGAIRLPHPTLFLVGSAGLLLCSIFSYCAVDQPVLFEGWAARNTILVGVPFAILLVSVTDAIRQCVTGLPSWITLTPVCIFLATGFVACNLNTLRWQAFGAAQTAIRSAVRSIVEEENRRAITNGSGSPDIVNVVHLRDYCVIPDTLSWYPPIVWTYMVAPDDAEPTVFVLDSRLWMRDEFGVDPQGRHVVIPPRINVPPDQLRLLMEQTTQPYALTKIPLSGRTLNVIATTGPRGADGVAIGIEYIARRLFAPDTVTPFVDSLAVVTTMN